MTDAKVYLEHANITVVNAKHTIDFLLTAIPSWRVRGQGDMTNSNGDKVTWYHIGDEESYITIQGGSSDILPEWRTVFTGVKHLGFVVPNLGQLVETLSLAGYELDHWGGEHPARRSAYYVDKHNLQFEFVEYFSNDFSQRNDYSH